MFDFNPFKKENNYNNRRYITNIKIILRFSYKLLKKSTYDTFI